MPEPTPSRPAAAHNLLFGILALQMDFISRDALIQAMHSWVLEKTKPLGAILLEQGGLANDAHTLLEALVQKHLAMHGNDPEQSLAAVSSIASVRQELEQIADSDLHASLAKVSVNRAEDDDSYPTRPPSSLGAPTSAGLRFRILRPHAKGGLGQVSVALDEELKREVALKEIQERHADDPESRARFVREAEITGGLEHPGIVPVYGLGTDLIGRPFYAMRFIRGDSLKEAIRRFHQNESSSRDPAERALALRGLLGRFVDVCQAVAYAHSRGVLHRDLKPGNVMLGKYGETLVVDWGLAKQLKQIAGEAGREELPLTPASGDGSAPTQMGQVVGTPAYMSPEQAAGRLDQLSPASDVYSLGATLYCLLTGKPPVDRSDVGTVLRKVVQGEFPAPRQVKRGIAPALEGICLKAMALRPQDRYAAPRELADDIEHWLADEPVRAYPEPHRVRAARWIRRHRVVSASALVLLLTATIGLGAGLYFVNAEKNRTEAARQGEATQRLLAEQAAADARTVLDFFQDRVLAAARPENQAGGLGIDATIQAAVDAAEPTIAGAFIDRPLVEASIRNTLGTTYWYLREDRAAIAQHDRARTLRQDHLGPDHPDTLASMNNLALAYQAAHQFDKALPLFEEVLAKSKEKLGPDHVSTLSSMNNLALAHQATRQYAEALPLFEQALAKLKEKRGPNHSETLSTMNNLATAYFDDGQCDKGLALFEETLAKRKENLPPDHPLTLLSMNNLASAYQATGQLDKALPLFEQALAKRREKLRPDHPDTLASMNNLAAAYWTTCQYAKALALFEEVLARSKVKPGPDHPHTLASMNNLAMAYLAAGHLDKALPLFEEALSKFKERLRPDHPDTLSIMNNLAAAYLKNGDFTKAEPVLRDCVNLRYKTQPDALLTFATQSQLGASLLGQQKYAEAEPLLLAGYERMKQREDKILPQDKLRLTEALERLVQLYDAWGQKDKADDWRKKLAAAQAEAKKSSMK
jgi:serine/threonine protein kinase/tetratricopeptide (TPR) repeat protein